MRFPTYSRYKPSGVDWFGNVPDRWDVIPLKRVATRYAGGTPDRSNDAFWDHGTIPWINSGAVNQGLITAPSALITSEGYAKSSARWVPKGALVMALAGQGKTKGMVAQTAIETTCNQSMAAICPDASTNPRYLHWLLESQYEQIRGLAGGEQRDGLNLDILGSIPCLRPPMAEQCAIAHFLDAQTAKLDTLVATKRALIDMLKEKRIELISATVTRGIPPEAKNSTDRRSHPKLKPSGFAWLSEMPEHWEIVPLKRLAMSGRVAFTDGDWIELPFITEDGVRLIQTGNVGIGVFREQGFRYVSEATFGEFRCTEVLPGDVLICRLDGPVGRACLAPDLGVRMITSVDNTILKVGPKIDAKFVVYLMSSAPWLDWVETLCRVGGGFRYRISRTMLGELRIPVPQLTEQRAIVKFLDDETARLDQMVVKIEAAIERLEEYRAALITAAATGKIDVRSCAA